MTGLGAGRELPSAFRCPAVGRRQRKVILTSWGSDRGRVALYRDRLLQAASESIER
jgi:hypothetical protein